MKVISKAKGCYIFYLNNKNKFFDFTSNSNILGHSFKKLTTRVKNDISNRWRINDYSIYHRRMEKLFNTLYGNEYEWQIAYSLKDIFFRLLYFFNIKIIGNNLLEWFNNNFKFIKEDLKKDSVTVYDMAYHYIFNKKIEEKGEDKILNYYYYPNLQVEIMNSSLIILPQLFSGNFSYINILVKKGSIFQNIFDTPLNVESLFISSSLKNFYLIKRFNTNIPNFLNSNLFIQKERIFLLKEINENIIKYLEEKRIIVNRYAPFYNYLPIILKEHEIKYLKSIKLV